MADTLNALIQEDQKRLACRNQAAENTATLLQNFCRAVNAATGEQTVSCSWVGTGKDSPDYLSVTNNADTTIVQVPSLFGASGRVDEKRTAVYTVSFDTVRPNRLVRAFGLASADEEAAIGVNGEHVHINADGHKAVPAGAPLSLKGEGVAQHPLLNKLMMDIYTSLPENARRKVDLSQLTANPA